MPYSKTHTFEIGDAVEVKLDIEQTGIVVAVDHWHGQIKVRCFCGEYINDKANGEVVTFAVADVFAQ
jgi:uncharacterized protein YuzE